jgi:hypothetical protein
MGKLNISQELSDKISKSLRIKQTDIIDSGGNKPIIREAKQIQENKERDSPIKRNNDSTKQNSPESPKRYSPVKINNDSTKQNSPESPVKRNNESPKRKPTMSTKKIFYKSNKPDKLDKINYIKISKIVFISSIVGGIGIIFGIKLGAILFL